MRKFLVFSDGAKYELPPITYSEWMGMDIWNGGSDMAWEAFLRHNHFHEIGSFNEDALQGARIVIEPGDPDMFLDIGIDDPEWKSWDSKEIQERLERGPKFRGVIRQRETYL